LRHVSDAGCFFSDGETEVLHLIDISGNPGHHGTPGKSYRAPPRIAGGHGRPGGNASPSLRGQNADKLDLKIGHLGDAANRVLTLTGQIQTALERRDIPTESIEIKPDGYLFVLATGGRGGNGGRGGDGQPGAKGKRGRNATRYRRGGDGGDGGNGGRAGDAGDGADGGTGGMICIHLEQHELGLLMLVKGNHLGGAIGFAGNLGMPGAGGAGGAGGSSYRWTETESYRDSNGNHRTRTRSRSTPGGHRGHQGRSGMPSSYRPKDGQQGSAGRLQIMVSDASGNQTQYPSPYDLELVTFDVAREYSILEPDSLISIDQLVVRNRGGMPLPENYPIRIFLETDRWLLCQGDALQLQQALPPGETHTFTDAGLAVRLADHVVDQPRNRPFRLEHLVSPQAWMEGGIGRPFRQFENGESLEIRFPVELTAVTALKSLAPGESTRLIWAVTNISEETFDQHHLVRAVKSSVRWMDGDMNIEHVIFFDPEGQECNLQQSIFQHPIANLPPGGQCIIEVRVGIRSGADVTPYEDFTLAIDLHLQRPGSSQQQAEYRSIDCRKAQVRVSERYRRDSDARFLLIANQKTTVNDIEKWTQLADYFGSGIDIWDISYYGFLDLVRAVDRDETLMEQWRGMTIIIPNNYYSTPTGKTSAFDQLCKTQFLHAAADFDISFYIVGDANTGSPEQLATALIPVQHAAQKRTFDSRSQFFKEVERWNQYIARSQDVVGGTASDIRDFADLAMGSRHEVTIKQRTLLFQPSAAALIKKAKRLAAKLTRDDPLHRWIAIYRQDTGDTDTSWGFLRSRQLGTVELRRTLDATKGSVVLYQVESIDAIERDFIDSQANKHGIFLALKFEDKVDRFIRLVSERTFPRYSEKYVDRPLSDQEVAKIGGELVDSILTDVFNEQHSARHARIWGRSGVSALLPKLNYLAERAMNYGITYQQMHDNEVGLNLLYELLASIWALAEKAGSGWDSVWLPTSYFKRGRAVSTHMRDRIDSILTSMFGQELSRWQKMTRSDGDYDALGNSRKKAPQGIERHLANQRMADLISKRRRGREFNRYVRAQQQAGLTYDPEVLQPESRVLSGKEFDQRLATEREAAQQRGATEKAVLAQRSDLLVALPQPQPNSLYQQPHRTN